jgi:hypothetical protein
MAQSIIKPAHQCSADDRFELVTDRGVAEALLRGYRGDAVAMHRLRGMLAVADQDVFRRDDHVVLAIAAGKMVKGELRVKWDPCERTKEENRRYLDWILKHRRDAIDVAATLRTTVQNILGLAAVESDFGSSRFVRDANNFFALTTTPKEPLPGQIGYMIAMADPNVVIAKFEDFLACAKAFAQTRGHVVQGVTDSAAFALILQNQVKFGTGAQERPGLSRRRPCRLPPTRRCLPCGRNGQRQRSCGKSDGVASGDR